MDDPKEYENNNNDKQPDDKPLVLFLDNTAADEMVIGELIDPLLDNYEVMFEDEAAQRWISDEQLEMLKEDPLVQQLDEKFGENLRPRQRYLVALALSNRRLGNNVTVVGLPENISHEVNKWVGITNKNALAPRDTPVQFLPDGESLMSAMQRDNVLTRDEMLDGRDKRSNEFKRFLAPKDGTERVQKNTRGGQAKKFMQEKRTAKEKDKQRLSKEPEKELKKDPRDHDHDKGSPRNSLDLM